MKRALHLAGTNRAGDMKLDFGNLAPAERLIETLLTRAAATRRHTS
jgi:hypothetical protein